MSKSTQTVRRIATTILIVTAMTATSMAQTNVLGEFATSADVGQPTLTGSATYEASNQEYTLTAGGTNMWFGRDQFHFVWRKLNGDFVLRSEVEFLGPGVDAHRKAGWMIRPSLDADAPYIDCAEHGGDGLTSLQFRRTKGADTEQIVLPVTNATVLQLERKGTSCTFSAARFGEPFVSATLDELDLGDEVLVGLFACSHNGKVLECVRFRNVRIIKPVEEGFTPYRDFIGSNLEILDVESGQRELIHQSAQPFEAPNWTPDGRALIYNVSGRAEGWGRLVRFELATHTPTVFDTGFAVRNNNDHVLSFDGAMLGISDQSQGNGESTIYTLPSTGGTPKRITPLTPSYLHGWSPDGQWLVYTGGRSNKYDIYKARSDGSGEEIRLTDSSGLNDGPEFTPHGHSIYFNSDRSGKMQIWRMNPDGSEQEQVTDDEFNNWFPHISPNGKWIVLISFPADIDPSTHPYYEHCYLRLLPIEGGKPKVIAYIYGGQGTINVSSWSPDSRHLAFVTNTGM